MTGQHDVSDVGCLEHGRQVVGQRRKVERGGAPTAVSMAPLVVEDDPVAALDQTTGHGEPDFVAATPAVRQDDRGRLGRVARDVPHGQAGAVGRRHRQGLGTGQRAPTQPCLVVAAGRGGLVRPEPPVERGRRGAQGRVPPTRRKRRVPDLDRCVVVAHEDKGDGLRSASSSD